MIRDSRHLHGSRLLENATQIEAFWDAFAAKHGFVDPETQVRKPGPLTHRKTPVTAYVNAGRWVADCPHCNGGIACWPDHDKGMCGSCGHVYPIEFPHPNTVRAALNVLDARPDPGTWNWHPETEPLEFLKAENATRGLAF